LNETIWYIKRCIVFFNTGWKVRLAGQAWLKAWNYSPVWECWKVRLLRVGLRKVRLVKGQAYF
jgi:hypothetical protein